MYIQGLLSKQELYIKDAWKKDDGILQQVLLSSSYLNLCIVLKYKHNILGEMCVSVVLNYYLIGLSIIVKIWAVRNAFP